MSSTEFKEYLESINGLKSGYKPDTIITHNLCECGNGWLDLIKELIDKLIVLGWNKEICQIKSKFGGLRFYINEGTDEMFQLISEYENKSYSICETCGKPAKLYINTNSKWIITSCEKCKPNNYKLYNQNG